MATATERARFIEEIAPCAQYAYKTLGKVLPSVCIAMACVESAYGTSSIMRKNNAFLGHKVGSGKTATKYWDGKFFVARTQEEYTVGTHTVIKDAFRSFDSMQQCVLNFYELLNTSLYARVQKNTNYVTQMQQIKTCGYMTSSTEVNSVIKLINTYGLTKYDSGATNPYSLTDKVMRMGSKGDSVRWLQTQLNLIGYILKVDGQYGINTKNAVMDFQSLNDLSIDGIAGPKTIEKLKESKS